MGKKVGRPCKANRSDKVVTLRMTQEEYEQLEKYAKDHHQTITDSLKDGLKKLYKSR